MVIFVNFSIIMAVLELYKNVEKVEPGVGADWIG